MALKRVIDGVYVLSLGAANAYLIEAPHGLALIDTGFPGKADVVLRAVRELGRTPGELHDIVLTHAHLDHIGSLAALVRATGATTWMHALDVEVAERGSGFRPMRAAPGLLRGILFRVFVRPGQAVEPASIDHAVADGDVLPVAGGLRAIHVPGHCLGQVALLWPERGVLFAGDAFANLMGVGDPLGFEDQEEGRRSQNRLADLDFRVACFGHGKPVRDRQAALVREQFSVPLWHRQRRTGRPPA